MVSCVVPSDEYSYSFPVQRFAWPRYFLSPIHVQHKVKFVASGLFLRPLDILCFIVRGASATEAKATIHTHAILTISRTTL